LKKPRGTRKATGGQTQWHEYGSTRRMLAVGNGRGPTYPEGGRREKNGLSCRLGGGGVFGRAWRSSAVGKGKRGVERKHPQFTKKKWERLTNLHHILTWEQGKVYLDQSNHATRDRGNRGR